MPFTLTCVGLWLPTRCSLLRLIYTEDAVVLGSHGGNISESLLLQALTLTECVLSCWDFSNSDYDHWGPTADCALVDFRFHLTKIEGIVNRHHHGLVCVAGDFNAHVGSNGVPRG